MIYTRTGLYHAEKEQVKNKKIEEELEMKKKGLSKTFFLLFFLAAVYFVLYILLTYHESYFAVGACGVILLTAGYLFISELEKERREKEEEEYERAEKLQNFLKETIQIQKALYTAVRKGNEAIRQQLKEVCDDMPSGLAAEEEQKLLQNIAAAQERAVGENKRLAELQVNALKAVAKYNKENARQLALNANENAERIAAGISHLEANVEFRIDRFVAKQFTEQSSTVLNDSGSENPAESGSLAAGVGQSSTISEMPVSSSAGVEAEIKIEEAVEKMVLPESVQEDELSPSEPDQPMSPGEIEALIASLDGQNKSEDEGIDISFPDLTAQLQPEIDEVPESVPEAEKKPAVPVSDDPNHAMSPDEIAALIASMTQ